MDLTFTVGRTIDKMHHTGVEVEQTPATGFIGVNVAAGAEGMNQRLGDECVGLILRENLGNLKNLGSISFNF